MRSGAEPCRELADRTAPMADRVLLALAELGHRPVAVAVRGDERGVVAEPPLAAGLRGQRSPALAEENLLHLARRVDIGERAHVPKPIARRHLLDQLPAVVLI